VPYLTITAASRRLPTHASQSVIHTPRTVLYCHATTLLPAVCPLLLVRAARGARGGQRNAADAIAPRLHLFPAPTPTRITHAHSKPAVRPQRLYPPCPAHPLVRCWPTLTLCLPSACPSGSLLHLFASPVTNNNLSRSRVFETSGARPSTARSHGSRAIELILGHLQSRQRGLATLHDDGNCVLVADTARQTNNLAQHRIPLLGATVDDDCHGDHDNNPDPEYTIATTR